MTERVNFIAFPSGACMSADLPAKVRRLRLKPAPRLSPTVTVRRAQSVTLMLPR